MQRIGGRTTISASQHFAATGNTRQQRLNRLRDGFAQDLCRLVFQVGAVDEMLLDTLLKHAAMITALLLPRVEDQRGTKERSRGAPSQRTTARNVFIVVA